MMADELVCELCGQGKCDCKKDVRVYFCPRCNSYDVRYVFGLGNLFGVIPKMKCLKCGFSSSTFPMLVTNRIEIEKVKRAKLKSSKKLKAKNRQSKKKVKKAKKKTSKTSKKVSGRKNE